MSGVRTIYVDGYNVIRNTPVLAQAERAGGLAAGRAALLERLTARYRHSQHRVVVVFDGANAAESAQTIPGLTCGRVIFSRAGESADAVIVRMAAEARGAEHAVSVVSDDGEVRDGAGRHGAATARVGDLQRRMEKPPRLIEKRFKDRLAAQRYLANKDDDEPLRRRDKGNPRRAPRKRHQRRQEPLI
jgi:predicted RNA-binding protein with PIN domain